MANICILCKLASQIDKSSTNNQRWDDHLYRVDVKSEYIPWSAGDVLVLILAERFDDELTGGGSSFSIWLHTDDVMDMCWYDDHFNGLYTIKCPIYPGCNKITINLDFFNFYAYREIRGESSLQKQIFTSEICTPVAIVPELRGCISENVFTFTDAITNVIHKNIFGKWKLGRIGCQQHFYQHERMQNAYCDCQKYHNLSIVLIGASHTRLTVDWILNACGKLEPDADPKYVSLTVGNLHYTRQSYAEDIIDGLQEFQQDKFASGILQMPAKSVLIFKTGAWDLCFKGQKQFIDKLPKFVQDMKNIIQDKFWNNTTFIFSTLAPYPSIAVAAGVKDVGFRNSFIANAANHYLNSKLRASGVNVFDSFYLTVPRANEVVCKNHYLCRHKKGTLSGEVGMDVMAYFSSILCGYFNTMTI